MAEIKLKLQPFTVPSYVTVKGTNGEWDRGASHTIKIEDLDDDVLEELCKEFRAALFEKKKNKDKW